MTGYRATAVREGRWWTVDVEGVGVTQARSTTEAHNMAVDLIHAMLEVPVNDIDVEIDFQLGGDIAAELQAAREASIAVEKAQSVAADRIRRAIRHLLSEGLSKRDAARILKLSPQRISQLTK